MKVPDDAVGGRLDDGPPRRLPPDPRWSEVAATLDWEEVPRTTWTADAGWFPGGRLNASVQALDRHLVAHGDRVALHWEGEPGDDRTLTYRSLHIDVVAFAAALRSLGVGVGDRVALAMGLVPEAVVAMLACARIGAVHAIVPAMLPADAMADRLADLRPRVVVTQDAAWRHGVLLPLKATTDEAVGAVGTVEHTVVVRRTGIDIAWYEGDRWFDELLDHADPADGGPTAVASDHPYLVSHLADRRGDPVGLVHRTAGLVVYAVAVHRALCPDEGDVMWTSAELAWMATQVQGLLGPLVAGGTAVAYEGMLDVPTQDRVWQIVARHRVSALVVTPSVVRAVRRWLQAPPDPEQVTSLRRVVTAGEPVTLATQRWLGASVGGAVEVSDAWGQTELGGLVAVTAPSPLADRLPDAGLVVVDDDGELRSDGAEGDLVQRRPWPSEARVDGKDVNHPADATARWGRATGDRARDVDGRLHIIGRVDRVFSVSGQLVSATEVVSVLEEHPWVAVAEVIDRPDPRRGRAVIAFVRLASSAPSDTAELGRALVEHVRTTMGGLAAPRAVAVVEWFPPERDDRLRTALASLATTFPWTAVVTRGQLEAALTATSHDDR